VGHNRAGSPLLIPSVPHKRFLEQCLVRVHLTHPAPTGSRFYGAASSANDRQHSPCAFRSIFLLACVWSTRSLVSCKMSQQRQSKTMSSEWSNVCINGSSTRRRTARCARVLFPRDVSLVEAMASAGAGYESRSVCFSEREFGYAIVSRQSVAPYDETEAEGDRLDWATFQVLRKTNASLSKKAVLVRR
jgi:hypothetical protein